MVRIYKEGKRYIAESEKWTKSGNSPVWKKIRDKKGLVKKGSGYILASDMQLSDLKKKLRKKGYYP